MRRLIRCLLASAMLLLLSRPASAADYSVSYNPYAIVNWGTILHCQAEGHAHGNFASHVMAASYAGYCAVTFMTYSGIQWKTLPNQAAWVALGSPNPDPGSPSGWGDFRRWPPELYGAPALPLNSLKFYLPGAEDVGLYANGIGSQHFYGLNQTTYMEGTGCTSCGYTGVPVRTHNPLGLPAGQRYSSDQEYIDKATALGARVIINHPVGAPTSLDKLNGFKAIEIWNGYYYMNDAGSCTPKYQAGFLATWDHLLETKSARIWGVAANDWANSWSPIGTNGGAACWPLFTAANRDQGKLDVLLTSYDLAAYLTAFDAGAFFAVSENNATKSAYPLVTNIVVQPTSITLTTAQANETVTWIGNGTTQGTGYSISLSALPAGLKYLRAQIDDGAGRIVYTQPFSLGDPLPALPVPTLPWRMPALLALLLLVAVGLELARMARQG